jgi:hypothetical protein
MATMCHSRHLHHVLITIILSIPSSVRLATCYTYVLKTSTMCEEGFEGLIAALNIKLIWKITICYLLPGPG